MYLLKYSLNYNLALKNRKASIYKRSLARDYSKLELFSSSYDRNSLCDSDTLFGQQPVQLVDAFDLLRR
ncbi:hypothetical protein BH18ACI3_BH18ACI3_06860 [soil metagenome]